jgi:hypothetical protein
LVLGRLCGCVYLQNEAGMWLGISGLEYLSARTIPVWLKPSINKSKQKVRKTKPNEAIEIKPLESKRYAINSGNEATALNSINFNLLRTKKACFSIIMNGTSLSLSPFARKPKLGQPDSKPATLKYSTEIWDYRFPRRDVRMCRRPRRKADEPRQSNPHAADG